MLHGWSKHIDVHFHFLCDLTWGAIELVYCRTQDQLADVMTKPLTLEGFQRFQGQLRVCQVPEIKLVEVGNEFKGGNEERKWESLGFY